MFAEILVPVTGTKNDKIALATAFAAAKPFGSHVKVLFCHPDPRLAVPAMGMPMSPDLIQELVDTAQEQVDRADNVARQSLIDVAGEYGVRIVATPQSGDGVTATYEQRTGRPSACVQEVARLIDMIVFPPVFGDSDIHEAFIEALTKLERPVLLSGPDVPVQIGHKIAIGWDGGIAAAHAVTAALPFLKRAESVEVLTVQRGPKTTYEMRDLKDYLTVHGVVWTERKIDQRDQCVADVLLNTMGDKGYDLLVIGGYGHSRLQEMLFGGATADIVTHPAVPVLMMH